MLPFGLILALLFEGASARAPHSPEDPYAFPKYRINFLNNHPVASAQANLWLEQGLKEGVQEFLGTYHTIYENDWPRLEASGDQAVLPSPTPQPKLKKIKLGPKRSYVCLIPPTLESAPREFEEPAPADPAKSWQLLQPLAGHCLYHKQGWFTYAYCHNQYVRQFREMEHTHPHPPGGRIPQEDTEFQAYTLGKSPLALRTKNTEVAVPDDSEEAKNALQLSEGAGQRYLTSRWTDGTLCDKTGRPREVEVQFHCSMTTTDQIQFLKETSVCQYILVVHTPRLCGEPGFQSARDKTPAAPIHCREMIAEEDMPAAIEMRRTLPEAPFPDNSFRRNPIHIPNLPLQAQRRAEADALGLSIDGLSPKLQSLENALNKLLGSSYKLESLTVLDLRNEKCKGNMRR
ncbi:hypothetical protein M407DRAFT_11145 [Tulasnella calospora MUT 4182]|uniref:Protein OS-9 homolog n=1 Tax=Tulasnella calospora MUT 4182 TaxID=1051891 RepID=A0A0C3KES8_9AGAM|nr:hypothetical protein M407DRAFT_11145 [Tulasnella calospora MUT 4182]